MNFYFSKLIAVFIVMFFNYSMNSLYTFSHIAH
jgi:putative flippase GtrA